MQRSFKAVAGRWGRLVAAAGTGAVVAFGLSGVASAADEPAIAKVKEGSLAGAVISSLPNKHVVRVGRLTLTVKGSEPVPAYCIDIGNPIDGDATYTETGWTESTVKNLDKVKWILGNSFPSKSPKALFEAVDIDVPDGVDDKVLADIAYVATQAAIWRFSDPDKFALLPAADLASVPQLVKNAADATGLEKPKYVKIYGVVNTLYDHLVAGATKAKTESEPAPLSITPGSASGQEGTKVGPFTVRSAVGEVDLAVTGATGATLVDKQGKPVTKLPDKGEFFVDCKTAGAVKVDGKVKFDVPLGRVFTVKQASKQKLILAGHAGKEQVASAAATCAAKPGLPVTGAPVAGTVAAGFVMLGTGAGLFLLRRRRVRFTA